MADNDNGIGFRRDRELSPIRGRIVAMSTALLLVAAALLWQGLRTPSVSDELLINVTGDVERPGWYSIENGVVGVALEAAGAITVDLPEELLATELEAGWGINITGSGLGFTSPTEPLAFALPIDINSASKEALRAIPGIGESLSQAIVADREQRGLFNSVEELVRVRGVGPATVEVLAPFVDIGVGLDESSRGDIGPH